MAAGTGAWWSPSFSLKVILAVRRLRTPTKIIFIACHATLIQSFTCFFYLDGALCESEAWIVLLALFGLASLETSYDESTLLCTNHSKRVKSLDSTHEATVYMNWVLGVETLSLSLSNPAILIKSTLENLTKIYSLYIWGTYFINTGQLF